MNASNQKGKDLEDAVYFIQKTILETDPKYRGMAFTIARNERVNADGVHHEIDILIRVNPTTDFEAKLLFECKNWNATVGKNEVVVLSEKIHALSAARGFLVAHAFSADAEAQARKDPRIKLVRCSSKFESALTFQLIHTQTDLLEIEVQARIVGANRAPLESGTLSHRELWSFEGRPVILAEIIKQHADYFYSQHFKQERARLSLEGTHNRSASGRVEYAPGELVSGERTIEWLQLVCHYCVTNTPRPIRSQFELHGYGRTYSFEPIQTDGRKIDVSIVISSPEPKIKAT